MKVFSVSKVLAIWRQMVGEKQERCLCTPHPTFSDDFELTSCFSNSGHAKFKRITIS